MEDASAYKQRASHLLKVPAAIRFVNYEPALGPLGQLNIDGRAPDWVIIGGESGVRSDIVRMTDPQWVRDAVAECRRVGAAPFLKQWGTYKNNPLVVEEGLTAQQATKVDAPENGKGGGKLDGSLWREFPIGVLPMKAALVARGRGGENASERPRTIYAG
jgi:protein gp37